MVRIVRAHEPSGILVTAADDKTIRIWDLETLRLLRTLRPPTGSGQEGRLFTLDVSPDGRTIAAAGWTGWDWDATGSIYFFDTRTGGLVNRLSGLPHVVGSLRYSRDGEHLIVALHGSSGLRVFRTNDLVEVARDDEYTARSYEMDVAADGRVVTSSLDGLIRLYDPEFRLRARRPTPSGKHPVAVRFDPSGARVAVGHHDAPTVALLSGDDLSTLQSLELPAPIATHQVNLYSVAWSRDGAWLYAAGAREGAGTNSIHRWNTSAWKEHGAFPVASARVTEMQGLSSSDLVFGTEDPGLGMLGSGGERRAFLPPPVTNFQGLGSAFRISRDASGVEFATNRNASSVTRFSLLERRVLRDAPPDPSLRPPRESAPGLTLESWLDRDDPTLNGRPLGLDPHELVRAYAITPDGKAVLLGTEWSLRLVRASDGKRLWSLPLPMVTWAVNVSEDGRYAVAGHADGTVRWYRLSDGVFVLGFFPHATSEDWIAWTPSGHYMASPSGDRRLGWLVNRGREAVPDFYTALQFERILYRPDLVRRAFETIGRDSQPPIDRLLSIAPPRIELSAGERPRAAFDRKATIRLKAERIGPPMQSLTVFVNGLPVTPFARRALREDQRERFSREIVVPLPARVNEVRVEVATGKSLGVAETLAFRKDGTAPPEPGTLHVVAIGVSELRNMPENSLAFAARDARGLAEFLGGREETAAYARTIVHTVADGGDRPPTRTNVLGALRRLESTGASDTVVLYLAGHGISDPRGDYYFVPADAQFSDIEAALGGRGRAPSLIRWDAIFDALRAASGRRVLIVDTCHARQVTGALDLHSLAKRSAASSFAFLASSKEEEQSQEYEAGRQGLYTYALLRGLSGEGDVDGNGSVTIEELHEFSAAFVERHRVSHVGPQTPQLEAPEELRRAVITRAAERAPP